MKLKDALVAMAVIAMVGFAGYLWLAPSGGGPAPDLTLRTLDGRALRLADYHGRPVLVTFWAPSCASCVEEIPELIELYERLHRRGLEIVAVAIPVDPPSHVVATVEARGIPYPVALDTSWEATSAFGGVRITPTSFLISGEGRIVQHTVGTLNMDALGQALERML